jgi:hypothetical protein
VSEVELRLNGKVDREQIINALRSLEEGFKSLNEKEDDTEPRRWVYLTDDFCVGAISIEPLFQNTVSYPLPQTSSVSALKVVPSGHISTK